MGTLATASKNVIKWAIAAFAVAFAVAAAGCLAEPAKAYADTGSHVEATSEIHVLVDGAGNVTIPNVTLKNTGSVAAYITGCAAPDELSGWTCDAAGKRIDAGSSITCTWSSNGPVSDAVASKLGEEEYFAGNLTYAYVDAALTGTVTLDNNDPYIGDTVTATVSGLNVSDDKVSYQWVKAKDGQETDIPAANGLAYTVADDDAGYTLICKLISSDSICQGSISSDATHAVKRVEAFAVYSADDNSLNFYKRAEVPKQGTMYLGKRATAVYTGLENMTSAPGWMLNYSKDIKTAIVYDEGISPTDTGFWFAELRNMKTADVSKLDMSKCKTIDCMFANCTSLTSLDLSTWNTRSLTGMNQAFQNCTSLTKLNVSGWDVSKVTNMTLAFAEDRALSSLDLSTWDNSAVTSMKDVFSMMDSLNEVSLGSKFKFVGVSPFLPDQTGHVTGADGKWYDTDGNGYAPADIPSNKAMTYTAVAPKTAFAVYSADDQSLNFYKRSSVPAAGSSFEGKTATAVYTGIESTAFGLSEQYWKDHVNDIKSAAVIDDGLQPTNLQCWFQSCKNMVSCDLSKLDSSKVTGLAYMFYYCTSLTSISGVNELDTANVISMMNMFDSCTKLTTLDLSGWKTSKVGAFYDMFNNCSSLTTVGNLSGWDTSNASEFRYMFARCSSLKALDGISNWNTSNAKSSTNWFGAFGGMFYNCKSITSLDLSNWDNSNTQPTSLGDGYGKCDMFTGMTHLQQITVGSKWKWMKSDVESWLLPKQTSANIDGADGTWYDANGNAYDASEIPSNTAGTYYASRPKTAFVTNHSDFNTGASGVTLPKTWQTSANSDAGNASAVVLSDEDSPADSLSGPQNDSGGSEASSDADVASKEEDAANDAVSDEAASQTGDLPAAA